MYCRNCGKEMEEIWTECPSCHELVLTEKTVLGNGGSNWWGAIGLFFPFWGVILFFAWMRIKPRAAKSVLICTLIRVALKIAPIISSQLP